MTKVNIVGVEVNKLTKSGLVVGLRQILNSSPESPQMIATTYSEFIVAAQRDPDFKNILNQAAFNTADGIGILWAASFLNRKLPNKTSVIGEFIVSAWQTLFERSKISDVIPEKISGADLIYDICELAEAEGKPIYLLGGHGDVVKPLLTKYPNLKIVGRHEGTPDEEGMVERINSASPDILLVAFGPVKQEKWIYKNLGNLKTKLVVGLGGTFDYVLGVRRRAPKAWQDLGLEWLYRLFTQPWRAKRMWNAIGVFSWLVFREKMKTPSRSWEPQELLLDSPDRIQSDSADVPDTR